LLPFKICWEIVKWMFWAFVGHSNALRRKYES
jgi:hypothetical protein